MFHTAGEDGIVESLSEMEKLMGGIALIPAVFLVISSLRISFVNIPYEKYPLGTFLTMTAALALFFFCESQAKRMMLSEYLGEIIRYFKRGILVAGVGIPLAGMFSPVAKTPVENLLLYMPYILISYVLMWSTWKRLQLKMEKVREAMRHGP